MDEAAPIDLISLKLLADRVLVEEDAPTLDYHGSIIIPEIVSQVKPTDYAKWGTVRMVGPACKESVKTGDRVAYGKFAGEWVTFGETKYKMLVEHELHCVQHD